MTFERTVHSISQAKRTPVIKDGRRRIGRTNFNCLMSEKIKKGQRTVLTGNDRHRVRKIFFLLV